jgi:hypothetical protein
MKIQIYLTALLLFILLFPVNSNATTYYISADNGNDTNLGNHTSFPWKTLNKVNSFVFSPGDSILFKRNEIWRGQLIPSSGNPSGKVYYGAFSNGLNPAILGSENLNNTSDWINVTGNIWKCNTTFSTDIGNVIFDNAASVGFKKWNSNGLQNQNDFWYNLSTGELSIYSVSNPAAIYSEIELALRREIISQQNTSFVTYENLSIKYGGAHGFGGGNTSNITIKHCEISFIGGGDLNMDGLIRYGNGVEFWGNANNNIVEKCKIWEIYDTGLTNQNHSVTATQQNIKYQNNLIWNCGLSSFEYWNRPAASVTSNIYFENNTCLNVGYGWGEQRPDYHGIHVLVDNNPAQTDTIYIRNNIFYNAKRSIYAVEDNINGYIKLDYNLIYQSSPMDTLFVSFPSYTTYLYSDFPAFTLATGKDLNSLIGDPDFVNSSGLDFSLLSSSMAIDAGVSLDIADDFKGNLRPYNGLFDIGAFEYSGIVSINYIKNNPKIILYPNPANEEFRLLFESNTREGYTLNIYNCNGQKSISIPNYISNETVNIENLPSGIHFVELTNKTVRIGLNKIVIKN